MNPLGGVVPAGRAGRPTRGALVARAVLLAGLVAARPASAQVPGDTTNLPPPGYGTLRQEEVSIRFSAGPIRVRAMPLHEAVIRLLAPDTYASLHRLREDHADQIAQAAAHYGISEPTVFLVTFFGLQDRARFEPELLTITSQNQFFRPAAILPLSAAWSGRQLQQRETASAIYLYGDGIRLLDPLDMSYASVVNRDWADILRRLERERGAVIARAGRAR